MLNLAQALSAANNRGYAVEQPPTAALDLNDAGTLASIFRDAAAHVDNTRDYTFPEHLARQSDPTVDVVANATSNLADLIDGASSLSDLAQIENAAQSTVMPTLRHAWKHPQPLQPSCLQYARSHTGNAWWRHAARCHLSFPLAPLHLPLHALNVWQLHQWVSSAQSPLHL